MNQRIVVLVTAAVLSAPAGTAAEDVVHDWNAIMVSTVASQNPFAQGRLAAITQLAVFEAVNAISAEYEPYLGGIEAPSWASPEAAAAAAAHAVLMFYVPSATGLDDALAASLAAIPSGTSKDAGVAVGRAAAEAMIAARATDGASPPQSYLPTSTAPGSWQLTAGCPASGGVLLHWRHVTPFAIASSAEFRSAAPPALGSTEYLKDYNEVKSVGAVNSTARPADRADVAQFYNAVLAVGVWNSVATQLAHGSTASLTTHARILALLNMAISDALVTVMETKYHYVFWRPETAIPAGGSDGNAKTEPDVDFQPFLPTPCFPGYPSAHASASVAARAVLQRVWGNGGHSIMLTHAAVPNVVLGYTTLKAITDDIDDARVYGGIHFRFDQEAGARQGDRVGRYVFERMLPAAPTP